MNAVELLLPDAKRSGVWMCGKCRVLQASCHSPVRSGGRDTTDDERSEYARGRAERCCVWPCAACGATCRPHHDLCDPCWSAKSRADEAAREARRFEAAAKLTPAEWGKSGAADWLYDARADRWFSDIDAAEDWYADDEERERPAYLWCSTPVRWEPDVAGWVGDAMHDHHHEDACDDIPAEQWKRLEEFVAGWWEEQGVVSYEPDFTRCVLLGAEPPGA